MTSIGILAPQALLIRRFASLTEPSGVDPQRIRDVDQGLDGSIYLLTDNAKGRLLKLVKK